MERNKTPLAALTDLGSASATTKGDPIMGEPDTGGLKKTDLGIAED